MNISANPSITSHNRSAIHWHVKVSENRGKAVNIQTLLKLLTYFIMNMSVAEYGHCITM